MANLQAQFDPAQYFLTAELTKIHGRPSRPSLATLKKELKANARKVHSTRGCGTRGHLRLCYSLVAYNALAPMAATQWADPIHPGANPVIPVGTTGPNIQRILQTYASTLTQYTTLRSTDQALLKQAMGAIDETFYSILEDEEEGYADLTLIDLLDHLDQEYGDITPDDLIANAISMDNPWSPAQPLEDLFKQVRKAQAFARLHDPISDLTAIRSITTNLEKSGVFPDALKKWRERPAVDHTLANVQTHFQTANKERLRHLTSSQGGYTTPAANNLGQPVPKPPPTETPPLYYCWSHGLGRNPAHTSATCKSTFPNHRKDATVSNMLGGCNRIHRLNREKEIWVYQAPRRANAVIATDSTVTTASDLTTNASL